MSAFERLIAAATERGYTVKETGQGRATVQCGGHDDHNPSVSVTRIDGQVLVHCHAGCNTTDVIAAYGLTMADLFDSRKGATYEYPDGRTVLRTPGKRFTQRGNTKGRSLFHADRIADASTVYVVEGEKDVLAVESAGGAAVCPAMGAGKAHKFDWSTMTGKHAIVVADRDEPGREHARQVAELLNDIATSVRILEAAAGKDAADHIAAGLTLDAFMKSQPPAPIDGAELLDDLRATLTRYVVFPDEHATAAVALWIAATHALPAFECAPRLVITSPEKRCGKTRLLDVVTGTCHSPLATVNATVAAVFRSIGGKHPRVLVIDEADTLFGTKRAAENNEDLRALLNAGHQRGRPALRCVGPMQVPTEFDTFAMAALAGIGAMPDTITDRAINVAQRRRASGEKVSQFRSRRDGPVLDKLRQQLAAWAADHIDELSKAEPDMPVEDRAADTWEPLIAVADAAGGHWPTTARSACRALVAAAESADEDKSLAVKLLADIRSVFAEKGSAFLPSADLVAELRRIEDSPWDDFDLTRSKLAYRLREFHLKTRHDSAGAMRGYRLDDFTDAFQRYTCQEPSENVNLQVEGISDLTVSDVSDASDSAEPSTCQKPSDDLWPLSCVSDALTVSDGPPAGNTDGNGRPPMCPGCGTYVLVHGRHRDDCTASKQEVGR